MTCFVRAPIALFSTLFLLGSVPVAAHEWASSRADAHAPIGVMADHVHKRGEWMLSYRYMNMKMEGNRQGADRLTTDEVLAIFPVAPLKMSMDMHMVGAMYAPSDQVTLMAMVPFVDLSMDHVTRMGAAFTTDASGMGDLSMGALWSWLDDEGHRLHGNFSLIAPSGSIDRRGDTPVMANAPLPYPMQLGSGSWSSHLGATYFGQSESWSWGGQALWLHRLNDNDRDYRLGDQINATAWLARAFHRSISASGRLRYRDEGSIEGADPALNPNMVPTADPSRRGGEWLLAAAGMNVLFKSGHRLGLEIEVPLNQHLKGPQLETDLALQIGWQYAF